MDSINYDLERILHGFTEDVLKELAKKLKRRIRINKSNIIHEILSPPKGKREDKVKVWQEINRLLRKDLEGLTNEEIMAFSFNDVPLNDQFKVGYMFTLSASLEIREKGEQLYCQAKENKELDEKNEADALSAAFEAREANEMIEISTALETIESRPVKELVIGTSGLKMHSEEQVTEEINDLHKRIKTLENKLSKANTEALRTKEQFEKLKLNLGALKSQWVREKEETSRYRNLVLELEEERTKKDKVIEALQQKLEQRKTLVPKRAPKRAIEQQNHKEALQVTDTVADKSSSEIDLSFYQGRKALIFAERDNEVDIRLNALGIIPIWAMEIDWNRPRRRMSTCEIVLYKVNNEKLQKLDEIRDIARYWNIPCNELLNI
ncbi:MAG TPA: hypothetical protein VN456_01295 [Desulfosporosinus sp.]|nr:hypothetical protein [Desulfosporosinus sp.]